jgi:hypothetical protein
MLSFTHMPMYFNTKKAKSRKRNLNSKNTYSDKKVKNLSNSDKKPNQKKFKPQGFFSSVLSETTPREYELSPQKRKLCFDILFRNSNF